MKKARLQDGQIVLAHQYKKAAHGEALLCADPSCTAEMNFRKEALTHGSQTLKSACFVSKHVRDHARDCNAHEALAIKAKQKKSIEQALKEGKAVVLNLNMSLSETFNAATLKQDTIGQRSTYDVRGDYITVSCKSVEDILDYRDAIAEKGGQKGLGNTFVNYKGRARPIDNFIVDSKDKYEALLKQMQKTLLSNETKPEAEDFPRLIQFRATGNTRDKEAAILRGTPVTFWKQGGKRLVLLQRADAAPAFQQTLRGENVWLVATPKLLARDAASAERKLQNDVTPVVFLDLHWKVIGAHQFTPLEEPDAPKPQQGQLKL